MSGARICSVEETLGQLIMDTLSDENVLKDMQLVVK
jgi:hypothetical protein